ncbi:MAG: TetR/AcrR family transcriptional regulator [Desulfobacterales bacterium]|nr:TetR/AcrR family transcriptional regulator [Desulfobacterales bacterium]
MPKTPMSAEAVEQFRAKILDTALAIIIEEGFNNLSARKIAGRLGVTATTIYNYYTNMDELNLMIRVRGFEMLHDLLTKRSRGLDRLEERFPAMIRAYVEFGRTYASYYDLMFNLHTPKYLDYVGSPIEPLALHEKQNALKCLALFTEPVQAYLKGEGEGKAVFVVHQIARFWSDLHGLVALCNSRLLHEVLDDVEAFIASRTQGLIEAFMVLKQRIDRGEALI